MQHILSFIVSAHYVSSWCFTDGTVGLPSWYKTNRMEQASCGNLTRRPVLEKVFNRMDVGFCCDWLQKKNNNTKILMAVKWSWDEFDVEHSIVLTSTTQSARYSNYSLILFFVKYGTITSFARLKSSKCIAIAKYAAKRWAHVWTMSMFE